MDKKLLILGALGVGLGYFFVLRPIIARRENDAIAPPIPAIPAPPATKPADTEIANKYIERAQQRFDSKVQSLL